MLKKGLYIAEEQDCPDPHYRYEIKINVSETEKAFVLTLLELNARYGATQIEDMFSRSKRVMIKKDGSKHAIRVWGDEDFTLYPYRVGVPFYFKKSEVTNNG